MDTENLTKGSKIALILVGCFMFSKNFPPSFIVKDDRGCDNLFFILFFLTFI